MIWQPCALGCMDAPATEHEGPLSMDAQVTLFFHAGEMVSPSFLNPLLGGPWDLVTTYNWAYNPPKWAYRGYPNYK